MIRKKNTLSDEVSCVRVAGLHAFGVTFGNTPSASRPVV